MLNDYPKGHFESSISARRLRDQVIIVVLMACVVLSLALLMYLCFDLVKLGYSRLSWNFISNFASRFPDRAGIYGALVGSCYLLLLTVVISFPLGISAAIYFQEFAVPSKRNRLIELNISNLAGVPAVVYGILGLALYVRWFNFDRSLISGALTMSTLILPTIILTSREALRAVPFSIREASLALGTTRLQTTLGHVLPAAIPSIMTGLIFALSRAAGEAAPLILAGATLFVSFTPESVFDAFTVLPIQIFNWAGRPQEEFQELAGAGIIVLLIMLLSANALAVYIRTRSERRYRW